MIICPGAGYHLNISKEETASVAAISSIVNQHLSSAVLKINSDSQITYNVKDKESVHFPTLFAELETCSSSLGIRGITITCTTMEDVFLKLVLFYVKLDAFPCFATISNKRDNQTLIFFYSIVQMSW